MYVCMYVCVQSDMHKCRYAWFCVNIYVYMYQHVCMHVGRQVCVSLVCIRHACISITFVCMCVSGHARVYAFLFVCI